MGIKVGDKLKCIKKERLVFVGLNEIVEVLEICSVNHDDDYLNLKVSSKKGRQYVDSRKFIKIYE